MLTNGSIFAQEKKTADQKFSTKPQKTKPKSALLHFQEQISMLLKEPHFITAGVSIRIINQANGETIFEKDSEKLLKPASNMKLYTTALALETLGPDYRIRTSVYSSSKPNSEGIIKGNIILYGRGDPTLATTFRDESKPFDFLAKQLVDAGVKVIEGDLLADESYFRGSSLGQGWEWLDLQWAFGAEISALTAYDNKFDVEIKPGSKVGDPCQILVTPDIGEVSLINKLETVEAKAIRQIGLNRGLSDNSLLAWGKLPLDDTGFSTKIAFYKPAKLASVLFQQALKSAGITLKGKIVVVDSSLRSPLPPTEPEKNNLVELAKIESPPLSEIIRVTNKFSQNLYAELLLRIIGRVKGHSEKDSDEAAIGLMKDFLSKANINSVNLGIYDGSGLSRRDLLNVSSTTELLRYMSKSPNYEVFRNSLPIAGVDGTLRRRMSDATAKQNVRAKTGTLNNTSSLSGYVTNTEGETFIFSIMVDNFTSEFRQALSFQDKICEYLVNFMYKKMDAASTK
ncbi:MAG: D-alanyl-D-alanine carboxypeptidase/D-alanyl-D-alanine-endopeptidase [Acidobacteria bacterium]|nr:D-alanyl-D-alanine carboxypeptidase/D-alanyl-D-alanine-endopeptidase [Acidobacteriota bacterium]